jgi:hypothetical protein
VIWRPTAHPLHAPESNAVTGVALNDKSEVNVKKAYLMLIALVTASGLAGASGKIGYGSRAGMEVTVVSMEGLDTARAVIRTKHTREDAMAFCREYVGEVTESCIRQELATPLNDAVSANCKTGEFVDFAGERYRFEGSNPKRRDIGVPKYRLRNSRTNEVADGSSASGYAVNMAIFKALCPSRAPRLEDLY